MMWSVGAGIAILLIAGLFYASYSIRAGIYVKAFCRAKTGRKVVALTFDDGPDAVRTPVVLDILKSHGAKAVFFCVGEKVGQNKELVRRMVEEGHLLGNHSWTHAAAFPWFSQKRMREELRNTRKILEEISGAPVTLFRPPFGVTNPTVAAVVKQGGYKVVGWSIRSLDTCGKNVEKVFGRVRKQVSPGDVILLHDRLPMSGELLEKILCYLQTANYEVKRIDELEKMNDYC